MATYGIIIAITIGMSLLDVLTGFVDRLAVLL